MKEYIIAVCAAAVIAAFCDILIPRTWQKYIGILTGAILMSVLISPVLNFRGIDISQLSFDDAQYTEFDINSEISDKFCQNAAVDIENRVMDEFSADISAKVYADFDGNEFNGIRRIELSCAYNPAIESRLMEVYGCGEIIFETG